MDHVGILTDERIKRILELTAEEIDGRWYVKGYGGDDHGSTAELFAKIREIEDEWLSDPVEAFNCMLETAQCLVRNLEGLLKDAAGSTVTEQTIEHQRQCIRDYQQRQLVSS